VTDLINVEFDDVTGGLDGGPDFSDFRRPIVLRNFGRFGFRSLLKKIGSKRWLGVQLKASDCSTAVQQTLFNREVVGLGPELHVLLTLRGDMALPQLVRFSYLK